MKLNLKGWHKVGSDKDYTTMRDPKGHELKVYHKALSRSHKEAIDRLPLQMAEGGMVSGGGPAQQMGMDALKKERYVSMAKGGMVERHFDGGMAGEEEAMASQLPEPVSELDAIQAAAARVNPAEVELERRKALMNQIETPVIPGVRPGEREMYIEQKALGQMNAEQDQARAQVAAQAVINQQEAMHKRDQAVAINAQRERLGLPPIEVPNAPSGPASAANSALQQAEAAPVQVAQSPMEAAAQPVTGMEMQRAGLSMQAQAMQDQAARDVQLIESEEANMARDRATFQQNYDKLEAERQNLIKAIDEQKIDPKRLWNDASVGSKIATGIGMILGGIGAGMLHQENPVMKMLNQAMENDLNAQKADLGAKENLLSGNLRQFGNMKDAMEMTRLQQRDILLNQLKKSAALAQGPQAKAMLLQEIGKLQQTQDAAQGRLGLERAISEIASSNPARAPQLIEQMRRVDPKRAAELQAQYVPGMGFASTEKGGQIVREAKGATDATVKGVNQLLALINKPFKSLNPNDIAQAEVIGAQMMGPMRTSLGLGTLSEGDKKLLESMIANPTAMFSLDSSNRIRLKTLARRMQDQLTSVAAANGIQNYDPANSLSPEQKRYADWARSHPQDPRAALVLEKLGL